MRRTVTALSCLTALVVLVGCSSSSKPDRAQTIGTPTASIPSSASTAAPKSRDAGSQLTAAQVKAAVLTIKDMPTGWAAKAPDNSPDKAVYSPAACRALFDSLDTTRSTVKPAARTEVAFSEGGAFGSEFDQSISSFAAGGQGKRLTDLTAKLNSCPKFIATDPDGTVTRFAMTALSFPNLGDETLALRFEIKTDQLTATADFVLVAVGHNVVGFVSVGVMTSMGGAQLEKLARSGMQRLAKVAAN